jgi:hypothetical protein
MVEYVDDREYHGKMGIFKKSSYFAYQSEFRIALKPGTGSPYCLQVGDLADISCTGPLATLNECIRVD